MSDIDFDLQSLLAEAREKTGLEDFGNEDFLPGLEQLLETYDRNDFTIAARKSLRRRTRDLLISRLHIEDAWKSTAPNDRQLYPVPGPISAEFAADRLIKDLAVRKRGVFHPAFQWH